MKSAVLILVVLVHLGAFKQITCELTSVTYKVTEDDRALYYSKELAEWKVSSEIECHVMCENTEGCIRLQYNGCMNSCVTYEQSSTETNIKRTDGSLVTDKVKQRILTTS